MIEQSLLHHAAFVHIYAILHDFTQIPLIQPLKELYPRPCVKISPSLDFWRTKFYGCRPTKSVVLDEVLQVYFRKIGNALLLLLSRDYKSLMQIQHDRQEQFKITTEGRVFTPARQERAPRATDVDGGALRGVI